MRNSQEIHADDAASAVVYVIRTWLSGEKKFAMYAARRAYETLDHRVTIGMESYPNSKSGEDEILKHPLIKKELERQSSDLQTIHSHRQCLTADVVETLRNAAIAERLFND
jgi:hypothetical protein